MNRKQKEEMISYVLKPCPACLKKGKLVYIFDEEFECNSCYLEKNRGEEEEAQK